MVVFLGVEVDEIAVQRELTDERVDLTERQRWPTFQITADKTVFVDAEFESGRAGILDSRYTELLRQRQHAKNAANPRLSLMSIDRFPECTDLRAGPAGASE